jgi:hypothetical protein
MDFFVAVARARSLWRGAVPAGQCQGMIHVLSWRPGGLSRSRSGPLAALRPCPGPAELVPLAHGNTDTVFGPKITNGDGRCGRRLTVAGTAAVYHDSLAWPGPGP